MIEERGGGQVTPGERAGMGESGTGSRLGSPGFNGDDGLLTRDPLRDGGELAGISEALQVHQDHAGGGIVFPVFDEIVTRNIRLVPHAGEHGNAEIDLTGVGQNDFPEGA